MKIESTIKMETGKRLAGWYPKRCQKGKCNGHAWYIQHGYDKGQRVSRVVCRKHSGLD